MVSPVPSAQQGTAYGVRGPYWSCSPDAYGNGIHTGCDYPANTGTPVVAARSGTARYVNYGSAFGNHQLAVLAGDGTRDFYAHMTTRTVADGAYVNAGQTVGKVGAEGNVTGPHLHFERHGTESGGWSCSVIRDPAPSINYQSAAGGGSGGGSTGGETEVTYYAHAKCSGGQNLNDGDWYAVEWDPGSNEDWFDGYGILVGGMRYSASLSVKVTGRSGAVVDTAFVETEGGNVTETGPYATHGAFDQIADTRNGFCGEGKRLRARVRVRNHDATLESATVTVLAWD